MTVHQKGQTKNLVQERNMKVGATKPTPPTPTSHKSLALEEICLFSSVRSTLQSIIHNGLGQDGF